jgi:hypothetical protein
MLLAAQSFAIAVLASLPSQLPFRARVTLPLQPVPAAGGVGLQACLSSILDAAKPSSCLTASSTPQLGMLYPLSRKLFVDPTGRVGLGTDVPKTKLNITTAGAHCIVRLDATGPNYGECGLRFRTAKDPTRLAGWNLYMDDSTLDELRDPDRLGFFHVATGAVMVLDVDGSIGKVGIGRIDPSERLDVVGNICVSGGGMVLTCSDRRLKKDVADLGDALSRVRALRGVEFQWRHGEFPERGFSAERQIGFIAQEVAEVLPEVVSRGSDGYHSVDYGKVTPLLVEAIQEQQEQIDALLAANDALRRANEALLERVDRLESAAADLADVKATLDMLASPR